MKKLIKITLYRVFEYFLVFTFLFIALIVSLFVRSKLLSKERHRPRLVWGSTPLINNSYWSRAMSANGYNSITFTTHFYSTINTRNDFDIVLGEKYRLFPIRIKNYIAFVHGLFLYDVFFLSFDGFFIGGTPAKYFQAQILKIAGKKVVTIPYGGDVFVYRRIQSNFTTHALMISYPKASLRQKEIADNVEYWTKYADASIPGFAFPDGFGRWDVFLPSPLFIDLECWTPSEKFSTADGENADVIIAHTPNHRGFKGTEFLIDAVDKLQKDGLKIQLKLFEKVKNTEVKMFLEKEVDILVEQLIFTGYGLSGLEGMSSGLPTISNLEAENYILPLRRWTYFNECPLISANPENIKDVLHKLITKPKLRRKLGIAGRKYVEKYHGYDSAHYLFSNVIDYIYGKKESIINLYHPILGEYPNRTPKIDHPLVNNRIED